VYCGAPCRAAATARGPLSRPGTSGQGFASYGAEEAHRDARTARSEAVGRREPAPIDSGAMRRQSRTVGFMSVEAVSWSLREAP